MDIWSRNAHKKGITVALLNLICVLLFACTANPLIAQGSRKQSSAGGDGVLAQVNDEVILYSDVFSRIKPQLRRFAQRLDPSEFRKKRHELFLKSASFMIQEEVLQQEARALDLRVTDKEIEKRKQQIIDNIGSKEKFRKGLLQQGLTVDMWERQLRTQILNRKLFQRKFRESRDSFFVTPEEMRTYYQENKLSFYREAKVKGHVVSFPFENKKERDQMVQQALSVLNQIKDGASFESIVEAYKPLDSENTRSFDWTKKGEFPKPIEYVLFNGMGERSMRGPFVAGNRVVILKRDGKIKGKQSPLSDPEVQKEIRQQLKQRKRKERLNQIRQRLIEQAYIHPRYLVSVN